MNQFKTLQKQILENQILKKENEIKQLRIIFSAIKKFQETKNEKIEQEKINNLEKQFLSI